MSEQDPTGEGTMPEQSDEPTETGAGPMPPSTEAAEAGPAAESTPPAAAPAPTRRPGVVVGAALLVLAAIAGLGALAFALTRPAAPDPAALLPPNSILVVEFEAQISAEERRAIGTFLGHFPGYDPGTPEANVDTLVGQLSGSAAAGSAFQDLLTDMDGTAFVAFTGSPAQGGPAQSAVVAIGRLKEDVDCAAPRGGVAPSSTEDHAGIRLQLFDDPAIGPLACAVADRTLFVGDVELVKGALDRRAAADGLATDPAWAAARASLPESRLAAIELNLKLAMDAGAAQSPAGALPLDPTMLDQVPAWMAMTVTVEESAVVVQAVVPPGATPAPSPGASPTPARSPAPERASTLAARLPASSVFVYEQRSLGQAIVDGLGPLLADGSQDPTVAQVGQVLALLGGPEGLFGWMGDAALVVTRDGDRVDGGVVVEAVDEAKAAALIAQLRTFLALFGGTEADLREEPYGDGTILFLDLGSARELISAFGAAAGQLALPDPGEGRVELALTVQGGLFVAGLGGDFVKAVLDTKPGEGLDGLPGYRDAAGRAGTANTFQVYGDVGKAVDMLTGLVALFDPAAASAFDADALRLLGPLGAFAMSGTLSDTGARVTFVVTTE